MHLTDVLRYRSSPGAGIYISLTRRCAIQCKHCSTDSDPTKKDPDNFNYLEKFVGSVKSCPPRFLILTGGEPLLLPNQVIRLTDKARDATIKSIACTGLYYGSNIPELIWSALTNLDFIIISVDRYHEEFVGREEVFSVIKELMKQKIGVCIQTIKDYDERYFSQLVYDIKNKLENKVPILVTDIQPYGRSKSTIKNNNAKLHSELLHNPCLMASWPVVTFDGFIVACCNQTVVDGPPPKHLLLGHVKDSNWNHVREKLMKDHTLRTIRNFGPTIFYKESTNTVCKGYCESCIELEKYPHLLNNESLKISNNSLQIAESISSFENPELFCDEQYLDLLYLGRSQ